MISPFNRAFALLCVLGVLSVTAPAEARNRTNEMLRGEFSNFSDADLRRYSRWLEQDDVQVLPGITMSLGGFHASDGRRYQMLSLARIYNESAVPICVRARQQPGPGALSGRLAVDNSKKNLLIQPGSSESITTYSSRTPVKGKVGVDTALLVWSPDMTAADGRFCTSRAPWFMAVWDALPWEQSSDAIDPLLRARLEGRDTATVSYPAAKSRAATALRAELGRRGITTDPRGWTSQLNDDETFRHGPLELTVAVAVRPGWIYTLAWIHNSSNQAMCVVGHGGIALSGLQGSESSNAGQLGIYLAPGSGRQMQWAAGTFGSKPPSADVKPAVLAYDVPPGRSGEAACQAAVPAAAFREVMDRRIFSSMGRISALFPR
ncbi:MAG: hypothetical protein J0L50_12155 [Sphingomonadales bacterium]|nr:hypothetical protein [Sphingomonadales bacterium]